MSVLLQESAGRVRTARNTDGTFNIVLITEGEGSTGIYSAELMNEHSAATFENVGSHPNHPVDSAQPERRDPMGLIGRVIEIHPGDDRGKRALLGRFKPANEQVAEHVHEFWDILAVSIFCRAFGEKNAAGKLVTESFDSSWPYRSVDIVLAAGAGGRFTLAKESLIAIESATDIPSPAVIAGGAAFLTQLVENRAKPPADTHSFAVHTPPLYRF